MELRAVLDIQVVLGATRKVLPTRVSAGVALMASYL